MSNAQRILNILNSEMNRIQRVIDDSREADTKLVLTTSLHWLKEVNAELTKRTTRPQRRCGFHKFKRKRGAL